jgi:hypothetical protein
VLIRLRWRYTECPEVRFRVFCLSGDSGATLDGYIVYTIDNKFAYIADFAFDPKRAALKGLLARFAVEQRKERIDYIGTSISSSEDILKGFLGLGFRDQGESKPLVIHLLPESPLSLQTLSDGPWYLVPGDND